MNMNVENGEHVPKRQENEKKRGRGRPTKEDVKNYRHMFRLNDADSRRLLVMYKQSGKKSMSGFLVDCVLNHKLEIIEINKTTIDSVMLLTQFFVQFRGIKNNYNQLFSVFVKNMGEDKARFMMKILDKSTLEFIQTMKEFEELTVKLRDRWLPK